MLVVPDHLRQLLRSQRLAQSSLEKNVRLLLRKHDLRPTQQRLVIGSLLFRQPSRIVTADGLHQEAIQAQTPLSLATVYNTLNQFAQIGLVRKISMNGEKTYFDTCMRERPYFYHEEADAIMEVPCERYDLRLLPPPPEGYTIDRVDVVIRVKPITE